MCLLEFLEQRVLKALDNMDGSGKEYFTDIYNTILNANSFMRCIYHAPLWLSSEERDHLLNCGKRCVKFFHRCAERAFEMEKTRWKYAPKFHMFGKMLYSLEFQKRHSLPSCNPLMAGTQQDEDFVGKISQLSRNVSVRTVHQKTLGRYLVALAAAW